MAKGRVNETGPASLLGMEAKTAPSQAPERVTTPTQKRESATRSHAVVREDQKIKDYLYQLKTEFCFFFYLDPQWTKWGAWSECSVSCGLGCVTRKRSCVDIANDNKPMEGGTDCPGPAMYDNDCDKGSCPGNWV